eukprot:TRINITY_DN53_c1_g1_i1.p2 TRINITY_DN53_c1_g1~~TRINITY_DN53_c1_g1_i1.p2  ORF type:complete len:272 (+),score=103.42 TRINITY_DN53_c1_g1_i1:113-817(+)
MPLKVLYLHGFEEHDQSPKPLCIGRHFDMHMPQLKIHWGKRHNVVRYALLSLRSLGSACLAAAAAVGLHQFLGLGGALSAAAGLLSYLLCMYLFRRGVVEEGLRGSFDASLRIAHQALQRERPDLIVGFSWGAALAVELLRDRRWRGPVLLLAPAHAKLAGMMGRPTPALPAGIRSVVVHSSDDPIVPAAHGEALAASAPGDCTFVRIEGEGHKMWGTCEDGRLQRWVAQAGGI